MSRVYDEASKVTPAEGVVKVDGPDGVEVALTPEAAVKTGAELIEKAAQARGDAEIKADRDRRK